MATNRVEVFFTNMHRSRHLEFSRLVPYSSLILTVTCVVIFLVRMYALEPLVKQCTKQFKHLRQDQQRSLVNHYVAASIKLVLVFMAVYPSIMIMTGRKDLHSPFAGPRFRYGDILLFVFEVFTAMYIFELFYREKVSYISGAHHIGAIIITQTSIVLFQDTEHLRDAELEFLLCLVWGFFDICAELWPHIAIIVYRTWPKTHILPDIFLATAILEVLGTTFETAIVFTIFFSLWKEWSIVFKVLTPILHILFSCAQLWGARVFWVMSKQQRKAAENNALEDVWNPEASSVGLDRQTEVIGKEHSTTKCRDVEQIV